MTLTKLKSNLHTLIDEIGNEELLKEYYYEIKKLVINSKHKIWDTLTKEEKKDVLISFEESENEENLVDNEQVMSKYKKWL